MGVDVAFGLASDFNADFGLDLGLNCVFVNCFGLVLV